MDLWTLQSLLNGGVVLVLMTSLKKELGGGFKYFLFSPLLGEMIQFDYLRIFFKWVGKNHQLENQVRCSINQVTFLGTWSKTLEIINSIDVPADAWMKSLCRCFFFRTGRCGGVNLVQKSS